MKLKDFLDKENMTIASAAKKLEVTKQYLWMIIHEKRYPAITLAREIEDFTKGEVKAYDLLDPTPARARCPTCGHVISRERKIKKHKTEQMDDRHDSKI